MTREEWLNQMTDYMRDHFFMCAYDIPANVRVSCGLPSKRSMSAQRKTFGQCWDKTASKDSHYEIFISPTIDDSIEVAATLIHELVHATVGIEAGHKKLFKDCASDVGLVGPATATTAGKNLKDLIAEKIKEIGEYPHAMLDYSKIKKQKTRLMKAVCPNHECFHVKIEGRHYVVRLSSSTMTHGLPMCGCCGERMIEG